MCFPWEEVTQSLWLDVSAGVWTSETSLAESGCVLIGKKEQLDAFISKIIICGVIVPTPVEENPLCSALYAHNEKPHSVSKSSRFKHKQRNCVFPLKESRGSSFNFEQKQVPLA